MELNKNELIYDIGSKLSDFKILSELGRGSYGVVYKVYSYVDGNIYVIKKMDFKHMKEKQQKEAWKEATILKKINHPHIIKYYNSFLEDECLCIVMEYAEGGDLFSLVKTYKKNKKFLPEKELWRFLYEILLGLNYLHSNNILHRDIKLLNLFLGKNKSIKIGDMGVSKIVSNINALHCTKVGTPLYLPPELIKQIPYDFKVDIWSVGCSLYHLASLEPPFQGDNLIVLGNNIVKIPHKPLQSNLSKEFTKFLDLFLNKKPDMRPSAKDAIDLIPGYVKENYNNRKIQLKSNVDCTSEDNNELNADDNIKKTSKNTTSKTVYELKITNENNINNKNKLGNNNDQNNPNIHYLINNSNFNNPEEKKLNNNRENSPKSINIYLKNGNSKQILKNPSNNVPRKDSSPKFNSGVINQNNFNNNKVINHLNDKKLNLQDIDESFENNSPNNNQKNFKLNNNTGRNSPSKSNGKIKTNFSSNLKNGNLISKEKQNSNFNLYKENPCNFKLTDENNNKKEENIPINDYKNKSKDIANNLNYFGSKSAVGFFPSDGTNKKSFEERNLTSNQNNLISPKSSFKNKNDNENNYNYKHKNGIENFEKSKGNPFSQSKKNINNENFQSTSNKDNNIETYSPKKNEMSCREINVNKNSNFFNTKRLERDNCILNYKHDENNPDNYKHNILISSNNTKEGYVDTNENLKGKNKEKNFDEMKNLINCNENNFKKRIFSSKVRKEKFSNIRPSTANIISSDNRNSRNFNKALNLGSYLNNENISNKIIYDCNNNNKNNNTNNSNTNPLKNISSNNNVLNNNFKNKEGYNDFLNANKISNFKSEENFFLEKNKPINRPFTANLIRNKPQENINDGNDKIINININVFNIQNNNYSGNYLTNFNRFLNPVPKTNLIYVNEQLKKNKTNLIDLPYFNDVDNQNKITKNKTSIENVENIKNELNNHNKQFQNFRQIGGTKTKKIPGFNNNVNFVNFNSNLNVKKTADMIFDNLAKTIGKGDLGNKVLTINDLK